MFLRQNFIKIKQFCKISSPIGILTSNVKCFGRKFPMLEYSRNVHITPIIGTKLFVEHETQHARDVMLSLSEKYNIPNEKFHVQSFSHDEFVEELKKDWSSLSPKEIVDSFVLFSDYAHVECLDISSNILDPFIDALTDSFKNMSDDQLIGIFVNLLKWPKTDTPKTRNYIEVWTALDHALCDRLWKCDLDLLFLYSDYIYQLNLVRQFKFTWTLLNKITKKAKFLTPTQLVKTFFILNTSRKEPSEMINLEIQFHEHFDSFSIDEIAIVCMGFFKSQNPIRDMNLLGKILAKARLNIETISDISLCSILKIARYSFIFSSSSDELVALLDSLVSQIPRLSSMSCTHIALAGTTSLLKHTETLNAVAQRFLDNPSGVRLKDLERLAFTFSMYNTSFDKIVLGQISQELLDPKRQNEIESYGRTFVNCVSFLVLKGIYTYDLIEKALDPDFIKRTHGEYVNSGRSLLVLNASVEIEYKRYKGPVLDEKIKKTLARKYFKYIPEAGDKYSLDFGSKAMLDIVLLLRKMRGGAKYVYTGHLLPHFDRGDIVICNNSAGDAIVAENYFPKKQFGQIYKPPASRKTWLAIVVGVLHAYTSNTKEPLGLTEMKLRQLNKIGYKPLMINIEDWITCKDEEEKKTFLRNITASVNFKL